MTLGDIWDMLFILLTEFTCLKAGYLVKYM